MRALRKDGRWSSSSQGVLQHLVLARELGVEFRQFLVLGRQCCRFFQHLLSSFSEFCNFALQGFPLSSQGFELFAVLLLDCIESRGQGLADFRFLVGRSLG